MKKYLKTISIILAFSICLFSLSMPASAALIGGDGGFYFSLKSNRTATLEEYHGNSSDIAIPSSIYSYAVTSIAENTFSNNTTIKSVEIPDTVNTIGAYAFYGCTNLEKVTLSSSVTQIKAATFYGCNNLTKIIIPASVTQIAANAFIGSPATIVGERGSFAEQYAQDNGIEFKDYSEDIEDTDTESDPDSDTEIDIYVDTETDIDSETQSTDVSTDTSTDEPRTLIVSHSLYKDAPQLNEAPISHNGNGTVCVTVTITDVNNVPIKSYNDTIGIFTIENEPLLNPKINGDNKVQITLTAETENSTTLYDVYRKRDDGDRYLKSGKNRANNYAYSESVQGDNYNGLIGTVTGNLSDKSITYTYTVAQLFPSGIETRNLDFYSDLSEQTIQVEVNYYDRNTSADQYGKPTDISSNAKTVTFTAEMTDNTLESFVENNLDRFNVTENVVDQHYFEFTQYRAVKALKEFKYYPLLDNDQKVPTTAIDEQQKYGYFFSGSYTPDGESTALSEDALNYHTSCYGIPQYDAAHCVDFAEEQALSDEQKLDARQQWVTFYNGDTVISNINFQEDIDDPRITNITSANSTNDLSEVTKIVIWAFNAPKTYNFEAHFTPENTKYPTFTDSINKVTLNDNSTVYIDMSASEPISGFYNQRVGVEDNSVANSGTSYLSAYGIENPYFGGSEVAIEAAEQANIENSNTTLKFDGWYIKDSDGFHKVSTERSYDNRITNNLIIYAGYVPSNAETTAVGAAITENETDRYIDVDNIEKVRYNTIINVFGTDVAESDSNIENVASLYVYLPQYDTNGNSIDWTDPQNKAAISEAFANPETKNKIREDVITHLTKLEKARTTAGLTDNSVGNYYHTYSSPATELSIVVNDVTISTQGTGAKIDCFDFEIVSSDASSANHQLTLTNKNRVQFSMTMLAEDYDTKPFLAFVAVKYNSSWYVSDNFVSNLIDTEPR